MTAARFRRAAVAAVLALVPGSALAQGHAGHELPMPAQNDTPPPLFTNLGSYTKPISTDSARAQAYFNQGVRLLYGFNHMEAMLAFREAAAIDPRCGICWWGVAESYGPDINQEMNQGRWNQAADAIQRAKDVDRGRSPWETAYIAAAYDRFIPVPTAWSDSAAVRRVRVHEDSVYAGNMRQVAATYGGTDPDAPTWYAEALLDLAPWDQWSHDGRTPKPGTKDAMDALRYVIDRWPNHPGANHFYIHATEASADPGVATASADRLAGLMPGASHMVHMPSHVYLRTGRFPEAAAANVAAVKADTAYLRIRDPLGRYPRYFAHNLEFLWAGAGMSGQQALSLRAAVNQASQWPADSAAVYPNTQHFLTTPLVVRVRFGLWDDILADRVPPPESLRFALGVWHYAQGFALVRKHRPAEAGAHLAALQAIIADTTKKDSVPAQSINSGRQLLRLAALTLDGELLAERGDSVRAVGQLSEAALLQDELKYDEPPPFYFPVRHSLGAVLLRFSRPRDAECFYLADLAEPMPQYCAGILPTPHRNPGNLWSYKGLERAYIARGMPAQAERAHRLFEAAAASSDIKDRITSSEF